VVFRLCGGVQVIECRRLDRNSVDLHSDRIDCHGVLVAWNVVGWLEGYLNKLRDLPLRLTCRVLFSFALPF
jgi:hypothetical protein